MDHSVLHLKHIHRIEFINSMCVIQKMLPSQNELGLRVVKGNIQTVCAINSLDGQNSPKPNEVNNPYLNRINSLISPLETHSLENGLKDIVNLLRQTLHSKCNLITQQEQRLLQQCQMIDQVRHQLLIAEAQLELLKNLWFDRTSRDEL